MDEPAGKQPESQSRRALGLIAGSVAAVAVLSLLDALAFRTGAYPSILEPDSSTGMFELILWNELHRQPDSNGQILAVGDSRMRGFLPRVANEVGTSSGYTFASVAVAGTTPRCWYYLLRDLDPAARRYAAIIIPIEDLAYSDPEENYADRILDLQFVVARLNLRDAADFAGSFRSLEHQWQALRGSMWKGVVYKRDLQAFLVNPPARLAHVKQFREQSASWFYGYGGEQRSLRGLSVDWSAREITFPESLGPGERERLAKILLRPPALETAGQEAYQLYWFRRILDRYQGSGTRFLFVRLPRSPFPRPENPGRTPGGAIRELAARRGVILCDERELEALERPELFVDGYHLNAEGSTRFSTMLAQEAVARLSAPRGAGS